MRNDELEGKVRTWLELYSDDVSDNIINEMVHLQAIQSANFSAALTPFQLLNTILDKKLVNIFPSVTIVLRIVCTLPVAVAEAERSFSALARVKNVLRSSMTQQRLSDLGTLIMESTLARQLNFSDIIDTFASRKARKAVL